MTIVKFKVGNWTDKPEVVEYAKQTKHFYVKDNGSRDSIITKYYRYFDAEVEALQFIADRNARHARSKEIDQIKRHAVELLEALDKMLDHFEGSIPLELFEFAESVVAKAKGIE